jgi:hypothetical protein
VRAFSLAALALAGAVSGCALVDDSWHGPNRQVPVVDGHVLWLDYACDDGAALQVRFLGEWANVRTADGKVWRMARGDAASGSLGYAGQGYALSGDKASPTWTTQAGAVQCRSAA